MKNNSYGKFKFNCLHNINYGQKCVYTGHLSLRFSPIVQLFGQKHCVTKRRWFAAVWQILKVVPTKCINY